MASEIGISEDAFTAGWKAKASRRLEFGILGRQGDRVPRSLDPQRLRDQERAWRTRRRSAPAHHVSSEATGIEIASARMILLTGAGHLLHGILVREVNFTNFTFMVNSGGGEMVPGPAWSATPNCPTCGIEVASDQRFSADARCEASKQLLGEELQASDEDEALGSLGSG